MKKQLTLKSVLIITSLLLFLIILTSVFFLFENPLTKKISSQISSSSNSLGVNTRSSSQDFNISNQKPVIPGTAQKNCYNNQKQIDCPEINQDFYGQDAQQKTNQQDYQDNQDQTITDKISGLIWTKSPTSEKITWDQAKTTASSLKTGGYEDWRLPSITELYSLINFNGHFNTSPQNSKPFLNTNFFNFKYDENSTGKLMQSGEENRWIDVQEWSKTKYVSTTMNNDITIFGVNFADGRIKGYPQFEPGSNNSIPRKMYARFVRGNLNYGINQLQKSNSGVAVNDKWSGLTWQQADDGKTRNWQDSLSYCQNLELDSFTDWRLPSSKELQSLVDYTLSPAINSKPAINPIFTTTNSESYFWSSTTILDGPDDIAPSKAVYIAFGKALGYVSIPQNSPKKLIDVHGAGAQRADPKTGDPSQYPEGYGPQGDDIRIFNYTRCVRNS